MGHPVWDVPPLDVQNVMRRERAALCDLLDSLDDADWTQPTVCDPWTVHGLVAHLVHDDARVLAHARDGFSAGWFTGPEAELASWLAARNERFVDVASELSPRMLTDMLRWTAPQTEVVFTSGDPCAPSAGVSWAGLHDRAPAWLGAAREYTERFVHQQQIRAATRRPGLWTDEFVGPVLDTFRWALVPVLPGPGAGDRVALRITGAALRLWCFERRGGDWHVAVSQRDDDPEIGDRDAVAWLTSTRGTPAPAQVPDGISSARAIIV